MGGRGADHAALAPVLLPILKLQFQKKNAEALVRRVKGQDPMKLKRVVPGYRTWPSDVDYNLHKSNATYAADMDIARSNVRPLRALKPSESLIAGSPPLYIRAQVAVDWFGPFLAVGGILPVAGASCARARFPG